MRMRYLLLAVILVVGTLLAQDAPVKPANIAGVWDMTTQGTPQGDMTSEATFVQEGEKIKYTATGFEGMEMAGEGTVKGLDVEWTVTLSGPMGEITLTYKGKVEADGLTMSGEVQAGDFGAFPWTAKKKK